MVLLCSKWSAKNYAKKGKFLVTSTEYDGIDVSKYQGKIDWNLVAQDENIQFVYIKASEGASKVDKKYFDYVLARIPGASTENCLVIGDSLSADIKGAQNAGLDSLWYNPNRKANTLPIPPNFEAASYEDIVRILL